MLKDEKLNAELLDMLERQIPKQLGEVLQHRFYELEKKEERLDVLEKQYEILEKEKKALQLELSKHQALDQKQAAIDSRSAAVAEAERNQKVVNAELRADCATQQVTLMKELVSQVFKSPIYKREISGSAPAGVGDGYDGKRNQPMSSFISLNETHKEE